MNHILPLDRLVDVMERCEPAAAAPATDAEWNAALAAAQQALPCANRLVLAALNLAQIYLEPLGSMPNQRLMMAVFAASREACALAGVDPKSPDARDRLFELSAQLAAVEQAKSIN